MTAFVSPDSGDRRKHPAVLFLHDGFAFEPDDWEMSRPYREAGYVVMTPVLRGEDGQAGEFTFYDREVDDVLAAADTLAGLNYIDPTHLYLAGHSAGGTLAQFTAMLTDRFKAAASISGATDQGPTLASWPELAVFDPTDAVEFRMRSPLAYATSFRCPTRLYYGDEEAILVEVTRRMAILAGAAELDVAAVEVPGDHFSSVPEAIRRSMEFFRAIDRGQ